jgi:hypothetical protein
MIVTFDVALKGVAELSQADVNDVLKDAFHELGVRWRKIYLPQHFGDGAAARYQYAPRAGQAGNARGKYKSSYTARKERLFGHTRPLEYHGDTKREALSDFRVTATRYYCRIPLPRRLNLRSPGQKADMGAEVRKVLVSEKAELAKHFKKMLVAGLKAKGSAGTASVRSV